MTMAKWDELCEKFRIWWYESGLYMEAMYDSAIDYHESFFNWLENQGYSVDELLELEVEI